MHAYGSVVLSQDERFDECRDAVGRNRVTGLNRHHGHVTKVDPALADRGAPLRAYVLTYRNQCETSVH